MNVEVNPVMRAARRLIGGLRPSGSSYIFTPDPSLTTELDHLKTPKSPSRRNFLLRTGPLVVFAAALAASGLGEPAKSAHAQDGGLAADASSAGTDDPPADSPDIAVADPGVAKGPGVGEEAQSERISAEARSSTGMEGTANAEVSNLFAEQLSNEAINKRLQDLQGLRISWRNQEESEAGDNFMKLLIATYQTIPGHTKTAIDTLTALINQQKNARQKDPQAKVGLQSLLIDPRFADGYMFQIADQSTDAPPIGLAIGDDVLIEGSRVRHLAIIKVDPRDIEGLTDQKDLGIVFQTVYSVHTALRLNRDLSEAVSRFVKEKGRTVTNEEIKAFVLDKKKELYPNANAEGEALAEEATGQLYKAMPPNFWLVRPALRGVLGI